MGGQSQKHDIKFCSFPFNNGLFHSTLDVQDWLEWTGFDRKMDQIRDLALCQSHYTNHKLCL